MRVFLNEFFAENLFSIIVFTFFMFYLAFKFKSISRFIKTLFAIMVGFVFIALLYKLGIIGVEVYIHSCNVIVKICSILENFSSSLGESIYHLLHRLAPTYTFLVSHNTLLLESAHQILLQGILKISMIPTCKLKLNNNTLFKNIVAKYKKIESLPMVLLC